MSGGLNSLRFAFSSFSAVGGFVAIHESTIIFGINVGLIVLTAVVLIIGIPTVLIEAAEQKSLKETAK